MANVSERRKNARRKPAWDGDDAWVTIRSGAAGSTDVRAKVVDASDTGFRIETPLPLEAHTVVVVHRGTANGNAKSKVRARVVWCSSAPQGGHFAGLAYE